MGEESKEVEPAMSGEIGCCRFFVWVISNIDVLIILYYNFTIKSKRVVISTESDYCSDYYTLSDYIYRVIQRAIRGKGS